LVKKSQIFLNVYLVRKLKMAIFSNCSITRRNKLFVIGHHI